MPLESFSRSTDTDSPNPIPPQSALEEVTQKLRELNMTQRIAQEIKSKREAEKKRKAAVAKKAARIAKAKAKAAKAGRSS